MAGLRDLVGERIKAIRKAQSLTQQQLAERSNLDDAYIGAVERGERNFSIDTLEKIVAGLGVQPSELFRDKRKNKEAGARQQIIDEMVVALDRLDSEQLDILRKVNKELLRAFK